MVTRPRPKFGYHPEVHGVLRYCPGCGQSDEFVLTMIDSVLVQYMRCMHCHVSYKLEREEDTLIVSVVA